MRHICCSKIFLLLLLTLSLFATDTPRIAFYYGDRPSGEFLERFDWVVVDADVIDPIWIRRYPDKLFAYVSVCELEAWRHHTPQKNIRTLGKNPHWNATVMDLRDPKYKALLLSHMASLHKRGYRHFFLDTLDSAFGKTTDPKTVAALKSALKEIIETIRSRFPDAKLIANRGIEVIETLCQNVNAFAIESLYRGIDPKTKAYIDIPANDRTWIKQQLDRAKACGLVPVVIDYLPPEDTKKRIETAAKIASDGYIPYVTDRYLQHEGVGAEIPQKRRVLLLYDSRQLKDGDPVYADTHLLASMPLEYLGYIPILKDIRKGLPDPGVDRYAAIILWPGSLQIDQERLFAWVKKAIQAGQKILFINEFGFEMTPARAGALMLRYQKSASDTHLLARVLHTDSVCNSEIPPLVSTPKVLIDIQKGRRLIVAKNHYNQQFTPAAITPWGGYAVCDSAVREFEGEPLWSIDPFIFFAQAIAAKPFPVPDPTTENGRRLLFIHIDGDGFIEKSRFAPKKYASEVVYDEILRRYPLPHSISVIEGEIGPKGRYGHLASKMRSIAQKIYRLDYVEAASHSYSHPFKWQKLEEANKPPATLNERSYHLPIPGYRFDLEREINASVAFINQTLLPKHKRCRLFFWTGDCLPREDALRLCENLGLRAINGGDTTAVKTAPWLSRIAPFGLRRGPFWQIYVGAQNENIYTHNWQGPFWGYRRVVQTFAITDKPRRLKPINIYYHFYSASKIASLNALKEVYEYALHAKTLPLYTSEYIAIAQDFYATAITRISDGGWHIRNHGNLRTLRIPRIMGYPDLTRSSGVIGFKEEGAGAYYLHLDASGDYRLYFRSTPPEHPYLVEANARIKEFEKNDNSYHLRFKGYTRFYARFHIPSGWKLVAPPHSRIRKVSDSDIILTSALSDMEVTIVRQ